VSPAKKTAPDSVTVHVLEPFQVGHDGVVYGPDDVVEVPQALAAEWRESGWVS